MSMGQGPEAIFIQVRFDVFAQCGISAAWIYAIGVMYFPAIDLCQILAPLDPWTLAPLDPWTART